MINIKVIDEYQYEHPRKVFFLALKQWDNETGEKGDEEIIAYIFNMLLTLGWEGGNPSPQSIEKLNNSKEECFEALEKHINMLIFKMKMNEGFLILGLVELFDYYMQHRINTLGSRIIEGNNRFNNFKAKDNNIVNEEMDKIIKLEYESYKQICSLDYNSRIYYEKRCWEIIKAKYFDFTDRGIWWFPKNRYMP